jgi:citrate/tricarballylate utilization protein
VIVSAEITHAVSDATTRAQHEMTICNACRYCEAYCPVFQAMEQRLTFSAGDVTYLANLCHNCGECLYACQYAPPHEFGVDVPKTMSALRVESYAMAAWPSAAAGAFRRPWTTTAVALAASALIVGALGSADAPVAGTADFYAVVPHRVMVAVFGLAGIFAVIALTVGYRRFVAATAAASARETGSAAVAAATHDVLTLRHLHTAGEDCASAEETRRPWRRWMHHCTFYGFGLCAASTTVAAVYHVVFGWIAPYAYTSLPVVLGVAGGIGLLVGPVGLFVTDRGRDPELAHESQAALDGAFLAMLFLTGATGLLLLALREGTAMPSLLAVHLVVVLALFVTLPYGKFVHGIYRAAALVKFRNETTS